NTPPYSWIACLIRRSISGNANRGTSPSSSSPSSLSSTSELFGHLLFGSISTFITNEHTREERSASRVLRAFWDIYSVRIEIHPENIAEWSDNGRFDARFRKNRIPG
ncbi:hypothetical protein SERLA73DRAFT_182942, partial [Serpula lacrymans var. lacrymans S7.3]